MVIGSPGVHEHSTAACWRDHTAFRRVGQALPGNRWLPRVLVPKAIEWSGDGAAGKD